MRPQSTRAALTVMGAAALLCFFFCVLLVRRPLSARSLSGELRPHRGEQVVSLQQEHPDRNAGNSSARDHDVVHEAAVLLRQLEVPELQFEDGALQVPELQFEDGALQKRAFSSKMRLIFIVGLEGTGHHYLSGVLEKLCQEELGSCLKVCTLAKELYPGMTNAQDVSAYKASREKIREEMQALARYPGSLPEGEAIMVRLGPCTPNISGMMSYPNFDGPDKALQYVDFRVVAEEAETAGVDLRIIYLARPARDIFTSDILHNHYGSTVMKEVRALITNAAVVNSMFHELGPGFATCLRFDNLTDPVQASRVAQFVAPTNESAQLLSEAMLGAVVDTRHAQLKRNTGSKNKNQGGKRMLKPTRSQVRKLKWEAPTTEFALDAEAMVVERLQQKLDQIDRDQCAGSGM